MAGRHSRPVQHLDRLEFGGGEPEPGRRPDEQPPARRRRHRPGLLLVRRRPHRLNHPAGLLELKNPRGYSTPPTLNCEETLTVDTVQTRRTRGVPPSRLLGALL